MNPALPPGTLPVALLLAAHLAALPGLGQDAPQRTPSLPPELRGAKVYNLPEEVTPGQQVEDLLIYRKLAYDSIDFERLTLKLSVSVRPVDRAATVRRVSFQSVRASGIPVKVEPFEREFKLSKKGVVDLPAPLTCRIVFSDLDSLGPLRDIVKEDAVRISGQAFVEVKLNFFQRLALRTKRLLLPVALDQTVPLEMFSGKPLLQMAANKVLDTLLDPASAAAIALAKERLEKVAASRTLESLGQASVYLIYCEYALRNPATQTSERFSEIGTGFVVSGDGRLLTAKRVVQAWKFDPQVAFLARRHHLEFDPTSYRIWAWPAGAQVLTPDGKPNPQTALTSDNQSLRLLKTAPDTMAKQEYRDPDTGSSVALSLHAAGANDLALIQLRGTNFHPLALADPAPDVGSGFKTTLLGFPFGLSQPQNHLQLLFVRAQRKGDRVSLDHRLNPGESGAPLLTLDGKVLAIAGTSNECLPIEVSRGLMQ